MAVKLSACLLLLLPSAAHYGALLGVGLMAGAMVGHFTHLGFAGERGVLASLGLVALLCCAAVLYFKRKHLPLIGHALGQPAKDNNP